MSALDERKLKEFLENQGFLVETEWEVNMPLTLKHALRRILDGGES